MKQVNCIFLTFHSPCISPLFPVLIILVLLLLSDIFNGGTIFVPVTTAFQHDRFHVKHIIHAHKDANLQSDAQVKLPQRSLPNPLNHTPKTTSAHVSRSNFLSTLISTPGVVTAATLLTVASAKESIAMDTVSQTSTSTSSTPSSSSDVSFIQTNPTASSPWEQSIVGLISGVVLTAAKTTVKYPLDTATVRLQMPNTPYSIYDPVPLFQGSFQGITAQLAGTLPSGAVFFAVKDAVTAYLTSQRTSSSIQSTEGGFDWDVVVTTCIAVGLAQPPYWLLRNPSEVIKTRQQVGDSPDTIVNHAHVSSSTIDIPSWGLVSQNNNTIAWDGVRDLYRGYWENIIYAYPADVIKFALYEILVSSSLQKQRRRQLLNGMNGGKKIKIGAMEGAMYGAVSTAISQCVTTPLDVVRNRIMVNSTSEDATRTSLSYVDTLIELGREEGINGLFAGVGPKVAKAFLSGAIQFALYEDTKQSMQSMFNNKR